MRYLPHTPEEIQGMLEAIGRSDVSDLFASIPESLRLKGELDLPAPLDEQALLDHVSTLEACTRGRPFLGAGCYPHHVPTAVSQLLLRGELLTAYTPYQPEVSQGTLQIIFEYQTMVCALTGQQISNASMYDGAHAAAEAALMALRVRRKAKKVLVSRALHPEYREVVATYLRHGDAELVELPFDATGATDLAALEQALGDDVACVLAGYPNFFGVVEPLDRIAELAHRHKALAVSVTPEAVALGLLAPPAALGADVSVGEMQSFGVGMNFGGPSVGFFALGEAHLRQMPGRVCGATVDADGRRGFVLTLSTREQHIRREKATSNICTNQGLMATAATIHLALLGGRGVRELARLNWQRAKHARTLLEKAGVKQVFSGPVFNEFVVEAGKADQVLARIADAGLEGGLAVRRFYDEPGLEQAVLLCVTEVHSPDEIARLADAVGGAS